MLILLINQMNCKKSENCIKMPLFCLFNKILKNWAPTLLLGPARLLGWWEYICTVKIVRWKLIWHFLIWEIVLSESDLELNKTWNYQKLLFQGQGNEFRRANLNSRRFQFICYIFRLRSSAAWAASSPSNFRFCFVFLFLSF